MDATVVKIQREKQKAEREKTLISVAFLVRRRQRCKNAQGSLNALASSLIATRGRSLFFPASCHLHPSPQPSFPTMPTCRRKRVVLTDPSEALLQAAKSNPHKEVYYLQQTGEIFETYEYVALFFHNVTSLTTMFSSEPMLQGCHFTGSSNSSVRLQERAASTTSRRSKANSKRHRPCTPGSPSPSKLLSSKLFNGVRLFLSSHGPED
jgi:hypothetical protein